MCGIFGYNGIKSSNPNVIKLLWAYSSKRGTDSTGIYRNNKIIKRIYEYQKSSGNSFDELHGAILKKTTENHTIIGHCRARSVGAISLKNAHPFEYVINGVRWIFAHNGTIKNIDELSKKYDISLPTGSTDSEALGAILASENWNVLLEYTGAAAFSLYNEAENALYLWKGSSKCENANTIEDERPLYYYQGRGYIYYASEAATLVTGVNTQKNIEVDRSFGSYSL